MNELIFKTMEFFRGDPIRIQHFLKVYEYARLIGEGEHMDPEQLEVLTCAAVVHDVGIRIAEEKLGYNNGKLQEQYGPETARTILEDLGYEEGLIDRVCYLVGHHHTYNQIDGMDYQILVEADFLVNVLENGIGKASREITYRKLFQTQTGRQLFELMYNI